MPDAHAAPTWPSLYNFGIEIFPIQHRDPVQPGGSYLYHPADIFRFTLYWTFIFYIPSFALCGTYAFLNLTFPPSRLRPRPRWKRPTFSSLQLQSLAPSYTPVPTSTNIGDIPLQVYGNTLSPESGHRLHNQPQSKSKSRQKQNERRSRLTFAFLVLLVFLTVAFATAVIGSLVVGYVLAGLFKAAHYNMSTWIPFFGGLIQALFGLLGLWPSVIDII